MMVWLGSLALAALFFTIFTGSLALLTIAALERDPYEAHYGRR